MDPQTLTDAHQEEGMGTFHSSFPNQSIVAINVFKEINKDVEVILHFGVHPTRQGMSLSKNSQVGPPGKCFPGPLASPEQTSGLS